MIPASDGSSAGDIASRVVELNQALNRFRQGVQNAALGGGDGLSIHLVFHIASHGPIRAGELAETTRADPSTVSRQVATLVGRGLLERLADPLDGRASLLRATAAGVSFMQRQIDSRNARFAAMLADWSEADRRELADLLGRFIDDFGRYRDTWATATSDHATSPDAGADPTPDADPAVAPSPTPPEQREASA
jgi:DNA-binding MarR family transcriptional regulator